MKAKILNCAQERADCAKERSANVADVSSDTGDADLLGSQDDTLNGTLEETGQREALVSHGSNAHPGDKGLSWASNLRKLLERDITSVLTSTPSGNILPIRQMVRKCSAYSPPQTNGETSF